MSASAVTDAVARHFAENVPTVKGAYAVGSTGTPNVKVLPSDIGDTPVVIVYWQRCVVDPGSYEKIRHFISADLYVGASDSGTGYRAYMDLVTPVIHSFRGNVGLFGTATMATVTGTELPDAVSVNSKPYMRLTFTVEALESGPATYTLGA